MSEALMSVYKLIWDDFCSWYLEMVKPDYQKPMDAKTHAKSVEFFETLMQVLHPFMPFISEEIWHILGERKDGESLQLTEMPKATSFDEKLIGNFDFVQEVIAAIRNVRKEKNIPQKEPMEMYFANSEWNEIIQNNAALISRLCHLSSFELKDEKPEQSFAFLVRTAEFYSLFTESFDPEEEKAKLQKELEYLQGFLNSIRKKLSNEKFVGGAPEKVVEAERKKEADALSKIQALENQIKTL
jgi:valyl-tRNA synthetase